MNYGKKAGKCKKCGIAHWREVKLHLLQSIFPNGHQPMGRAGTCHGCYRIRKEELKKNPNQPVVGSFTMKLEDVFGDFE
ncbi:unnamed protein product [marine sediment metagenome]|uniref:Uncharacterized protein n=1 Tax=marine sediment metagenome TaxID=412755 RepID=X0TQ57_9ZZZZ